MRLRAVVLPDLGEGLSSPLVVSGWFARRGERVAEGDRLVEVLAGPAVFDVSAPVAGRLARIERVVDDLVRPGDVLGHLEPDGEGDPETGPTGR